MQCNKLWFCKLGHRILCGNNLLRSLWALWVAYNLLPDTLCSNCCINNSVSFLAMGTRNPMLCPIKVYITIMTNFGSRKHQWSRKTQRRRPLSPGWKLHFLHNRHLSPQSLGPRLPTSDALGGVASKIKQIKRCVFTWNSSIRDRCTCDSDTYHAAKQLLWAAHVPQHPSLSSRNLFAGNPL